MALDLSKLEVSIEEGERWRRTLRATVPWRLVEAERKAQIRGLAKKLNLPGFRAGRVPDAIVEKRFGTTVDDMTVEQIRKEVFRGAVNEHRLKPITPGRTEVTGLSHGSDLQFVVSFEVEPDVELARISGFRVRRPPVRVTDDHVAATLDGIRAKMGTWIPEDSGRPGDGDHVSVRILDTGAGEAKEVPYELVLGHGQALPDVETAIRSLEVGETGDFTVRFPGPSEASADHDGKTQVTISLDARKRLELPELDDELAASASAFGTLDELRDAIRARLRRDAETRADRVVHRELAEQIVAANGVEVPDSMVERAVEQSLANEGEMTEEQATAAREELRPQLRREISRHLVIDRVAESEGLAATSDEIHAEVESIAAGSTFTVSQMYTKLRKSGDLRRLAEAITEKRVFDYLTSKSEITTAA